MRGEVGPATGPSRRSAAETLSPGWAALAFVSWGMGAWAPFLYASLRTGYRRWRAWAVAYATLGVGALALAAAGRAAGGVLRTIDVLPLAALSFASAIHTLAIRYEYAQRMAARNDPHLLAARKQAQLRERARELVVSDPRQARAIGVGRPDVARAFDGGLIDVNHASAVDLASLPGFNPDIVARIVDLRAEGVGFSSLGDLDLVLNLPNAVLQELQDTVVFVPRDPAANAQEPTPTAGPVRVVHRTRKARPSDIDGGLRSSSTLDASRGQTERPGCLPELPVELRVRTSIRGGYDGGSLVVEPGKLTLRLSGGQWVRTDGLKEIVHTSPIVKRVTRRFGLHASQPTFVLHDDATREIGAVSCSPFHAEDWPPPLEEAGFEIHDVTTWISSTGEPGWGKPPERVRRRPRGS